GDSPRETVPRAERTQCSLVDLPSEDASTVGVDRIQKSTVGRDVLVAEARLALDTDRRDRIVQREVARRRNAEARHRPVGEVRREHIPPVAGCNCPADLAATVADRARDEL